MMRPLNFSEINMCDFGQTFDFSTETYVIFDNDFKKKKKKKKNLKKNPKPPVLSEQSEELVNCGQSNDFFFYAVLF